MHSNLIMLMHKLLVLRRQLRTADGTTALLLFSCMCTNSYLVVKGKFLLIFIRHFIMQKIVKVKDNAQFLGLRRQLRDTNRTATLLLFSYLNGNIKEV